MSYWIIPVSTLSLESASGTYCTSTVTEYRGLAWPGFIVHCIVDCNAVILNVSFESQKQLKRPGCLLDCQTYNPTSYKNPLIFVLFWWPKFMVQDHVWMTKAQVWQCWHGDTHTGALSVPGLVPLTRRLNRIYLETDIRPYLSFDNNSYSSSDRPVDKQGWHWHQIRLMSDWPAGQTRHNR